MKTTNLARTLVPIVSLSLALSVTTSCKKQATEESTAPAGNTAAAPEPEAKPEKVYPAPPPPTEPRPVNFPEIMTAELPNKMQIIVVENHEVPLVNVQVVVKAGTVYDDLVANMTSDMLSEGTKKRSKEKIDAAIEQLGASIGVFASDDNAYITTSVLKPDLSKAITLLADVAKNPKFDNDALEKKKKQAIEGVKGQKSDASTLARTLMSQLLYPEGHPYADDFWSDEQIEAVTTEQLAAFHSAWYRPNNAYIMFSGDITMDEAKKIAKKHFGYWEPAESFGEHPLSKFTGEQYQAVLPTKMQVHIVDRKSASVEIYLANLSLARNSPDWESMTVLNRVFGSGITSRLFADIRETKKLTYNVNSYTAAAKGIGVFAIATQTKKVAEMMIALFDHVRDIRETGPSEEEFTEARDSIARSFPLQIETASQVAGRTRTVLTYGLEADYWNTYRDRVLAVTREQTAGAAQKYIHSVPVIVMVGREKKIRAQLADVPQLKDAEVIVYDTDLKPKAE
jgi:zinc protease